MHAHTPVIVIRRTLLHQSGGVVTVRHDLDRDYTFVQDLLTEAVINIKGKENAFSFTERRRSSTITTRTLITTEGLGNLKIWAVKESAPRRTSLLFLTEIGVGAAPLYPDHYDELELHLFMLTAPDLDHPAAAQLQGIVLAAQEMPVPPLPVLSSPLSVPAEDDQGPPQVTDERDDDLDPDDPLDADSAPPQDLQPLADEIDDEPPF